MIHVLSLRCGRSSALRGALIAVLSCVLTGAAAAMPIAPLTPGDPIGACCLPTGCFGGTANECLKFGGIYQGDFTECADVTCPVSGACCFDAGGCSDVFEGDCDGLGGFYQGNGTECPSFAPGSGICDTGACCAVDGSCVELIGEACAEIAGFYQGDGTSCGSGSCPDIGACCMVDTSCAVLEFDACVSAGGNFQAAGFECAQVDCEPFGACCFGSGCTGGVEREVCEGDRGVYAGDGTACDDVDCFSTGACCFVDGTCMTAFPAVCASAGGSFRGAGTFCGKTPCTGVCCLPGGTCEVSSVSECVSAGGSFQSIGSECETSECELFQPPSEFSADETNFRGGDGELDAPSNGSSGGSPGGSGDGPILGGRDVAAVQKSDDPTQNGQVQVFINAGSAGGEWQGLNGLPPVPVGADPSDLSVGLIDGDAFADVVVTNRGDGTLSVLLNTADLLGTVAPASVVTGFVAPVGVAIGDFVTDAGGVNDVFVIDEGTNMAMLLQGDGSGQFLNIGFTVTLPLGPTALDPVDLDNDKDEDVVMTEGGPSPFDGPGVPGRVQVLRRGPGGFATPIVLPVGVNPVDLAFGDFDGDGGVDIATANRGGNSVSILLSDGLSFEKAFDVGVDPNPESITAGDFDRDGDIDLAVTVDTGVQVIMNTMVSDDDIFTPSMAITLGPGVNPNFIRSFDATGNGGIDLITGNEGGLLSSNTLSVLPNSAVPELIDCNHNGIADACDIVNGAEDCNSDGVPDECETAILEDPAISIAADDCPDAEMVCPGHAYVVDTTGATPDADDPNCGIVFGLRDTWYRYRPAWTGSLFISIFGAPTQPVLSVYDACPGDDGIPIECNAINPFGVRVAVERDHEYLIRVAGRTFSTGTFDMHLLGPDCMLTLNDRNGNGTPDDCECFSDVDGNGIVDIHDFLLVMVAYGPCPRPPATCAADVDGSGVVNDEDLREVLSNLGACPGGVVNPFMGPTPCN